MTQEELKNNFSKNLTRLRKANNLTQLSLAEKLNYSDKAISKWEVGSVMPDVETLTNISDFFGITVNDLIYPEKTKFKRVFWHNHIITTALSIGIVWFLATIIYFVLQQATDLTRLWIVFILAFPISFIVLLVFSCIWFNKAMQMISISCLAWSTLITLYLSVNIHSYWFLFIIGAIGQLLIIFWSQLKRIVKPSNKN